jgi:N-acetylglutamate synthase-like GNAT family acetyltransferase
MFSPGLKGRCLLLSGNPTVYQFNGETMNIRKATIDDIPSLSRHHRLMMEDIWEQKGSHIDKPAAEALESAYRKKVEEHTPRRSCLAWVVEREGQIIASGAQSIVSLTSVPFDLNSRVGYLHSINTDKANQDQRCARTIVASAVDHCRRQGIRRVILNFSAAGRPVYEKAGFVPASETIKLLIE